MSNLHYKANGSLDMRYSSSRAAVSSGFSGGSTGGGGGSSYSGYGGGGGANSYYSSSSSSGGGGGLSYKKDGTLDMRYSSSRAAVSTGFSGGTGGGGGSSRYSGVGGGTSSYNPSSSSGGGGLNYKKDGSLDMRYSSSKAAASSGFSGGSTGGGASSDLHYKKDGSLDQRYSSSKGTSEGGHHLSSAFRKITISTRGADHKVIPAHIPLTKSGLPNMRYSVSKQWIAEQCASSAGIPPSWLPRKKDGSLDTSKAVAAHFLSKAGRKQMSSDDLREKYYADLLRNNSIFKEKVTSFRQQPNTVQILQIPGTYLLPDTAVLKNTMKRTNLDFENNNSLNQMISSEIDKKIPEIEYKDIKIGDEEGAKIGNGSFGVVLKANWNGQIVAVKRLHLQDLNKREKPMFIKEIKVLALVGEHPNLVRLHGYCIKPPCLVMEYVALGSLSHLLHYCEDEQIQAAITDGRVKGKLASGVANGMWQLHEVGVVHGDLKPANVLVDRCYIAKIADFGLATLRGRTSASVASTATSRDDDGIAGTGAYMAPELLDSTGPPHFTVDIYSFGILLNELITEVEPFSSEEGNFAGRGVFGAANYAKLGKRPKIKEKTPLELKVLIQECWSSVPSKRPSFKAITSLISTVKFPNSF